MIHLGSGSDRWDIFSPPKSTKNDDDNVRQQKTVVSKTLYIYIIFLKIEWMNTGPSHDPNYKMKFFYICMYSTT